MALCHKDTSSAVHSMERYRHSCKISSQVNMKTSSVSLSLHQEVQLTELCLLGSGKFRNATKVTLPAKVVQEGTRLGWQAFSLQLQRCWGLCCPGCCQWGCSSMVFADTALPGQALLLYEQKMWPWRFRGHIEPYLAQMIVSHSSETPPGPCSFPYKWGKLYSLVMSQATDC